MLKKLASLTKKQIIIMSSTAGVIVIAILCVAIFHTVSANQVSTNSETLYLEETASLGSIIVGVSESGTASMITTEIQSEAGMDIVEVYVSSGQFVVEGEIIALMDLSDYEASDSSNEVSLETAETELAALESEYEEKMITIQKTYDLSVSAGEAAYSVYTLEIAEIDDGLTEITDNISDLNDEIDDIEDQIANGLYDDQGLADASDAVGEMEDTIAALTIEITTAKASASTPEELEAVSELENELTSYENQLTSLESDYEKAKEDYTTAYNNLDDELESLESQLTSQQTAKTKYLNTMDSSTINAQATYDLAILEYNNAQDVYDSAVAVYEDAITELEETIVELEEAIESGDDDDDETFIYDEDGNVYAPCTGYIMSVEEIDMSDLIPSLIISIADSSYAELYVSIDQEDIADVEVGMDVSVLFDAYEDYSMTAYVDAIEMTTSSGISASVSYTVTIVCEVPEVDEETIAIFQGMTATTTFILKQVQEVIVISSKCVTTTNGVETVLVLRDDGTIDEVEIVTGFSDGFDVEVTSGLEEGDVVIIESAVTSGAY